MQILKGKGKIFVNIKTNLRYIQIVHYIINIYGYYLKQIELVNNLICFTINKSIIQNFNNFLKKHTKTQLNSLIDLFGIDTLNSLKIMQNFLFENMFRFQIIYHLFSHRLNLRCYIKLNCQDCTVIDSITNIFTNAN